MSEPDPTAETPRSAENPAAGVADVNADLESLGGLDLSQHPAVYERIHGELRGALASIDDA